jgi:DNA helicase-2/ATP-dependent DNA helicase PcrA
MEGFFQCLIFSFFAIKYTYVFNPVGKHFESFVKAAVNGVMHKTMQGGAAMPARNHPDYREEKNKLEYTLGYVRKSLESSASEKQRIDEDVARRKRHFDSADSESYIGLMINTMLQDRMELRLKNLKSAENRPYFARIDFREGGREAPEKLYIGKMVLIREEDQELIIVDR